MTGRLLNLVNSVEILVEHAQGIDYRRVAACHWLKSGLRRGDWVRWNPATGVAEIRHYVVLGDIPHPERARFGVRLALLVAPVPDVVIAGVTYLAQDRLPPQPDIVQACQWQRLDPAAFDERG